MKKAILFIFTALCFVSFTQAQLIMDSNGRVGIDEDYPLSTLSIGAEGSTTFKVSSTGTDGQYHRAINGRQSTLSSASHSNYGVLGQILYGVGGFKLYGLYGNSYRGSTPTNARSYGVLGTAGNGSNGFNYGVYGWLEGTRDGAAVYGSVTGDRGVDGQYAGYFDGDVNVRGTLTAVEVVETSDINLKKDIRIIDESVISKLEGLQVIRYVKKHYSEYKELSDTADLSIIASELESEIYTKDRIGLIAQELQVAFPEVVRKGNSGYLQVNYIQLIPILVKAITEQHAEIVSLQSQINNLSLEKELKGSIVKDNDSFDQLGIESNLFQNTPNPFSTTTKIKYALSETVTQAALYIYNMSGKQLKNYELHHRGDGEISIEGGEFDAGMFIYTLIADGHVVGSKQMILTDK